ncbi:MAG TPA: radical SAM protein [Thermoanaerobaculia bacterium]|nr:radical SAM protein [Thermoanaerobaculia bacterium]
MSETARRPARQKIVLYNPEAVFFTMPLALVTIASHLDPERYDVAIVDARLEADPVAAVVAQLDGALCLGVTVLTGAPIADAVRISRAAKAHRPDIPVVWGGWHPSMFGRECLDEPSVDITVQAQGEITFTEILERLASGQSLAGCQGCTYREADGSARLNPPRPLRDVNELRPHDYSLIEVERYFPLKGKRQLDYISSQGCAFRCAFCADPFVYNRKWTGLAPQRIGEEIEALWHRYRFDDVNFQDETYFTYPDRVAAVADEFIGRKLPITWAATMRADQGHRLSEEIFAKCKQSGLRRLLIGVESGSQEMMDRIKKDIKLEQVFFCAERCRRYGVAVNFPFIVGFPEESDDSIRATLKVVKRLRAMSPDFQTPIFYFKPYPGSSITHEAVANGFALPCSLDEWSDFDFVGSIGPWVSPEKYRLIERFKFFQQVAWDRVRPWRRPLQRLARWRCTRDFYSAPVEKVLSNLLHPPPQLS